MGQMRQLRRALCSSVGKPLAFQIKDGYGASISGVMERVIRHHKVHDDDILGALAHSEDDGPAKVAIQGPVVIPQAANGKAVAYIPVKGVALYDLEWQPYCFSTSLLAERINDFAGNNDIGQIVLDFDTPGGHVTGTEEAGDAIWAAKKKKKVTAIINPLAASAGYWLASQATEIISTKSGEVGSIGVFMMHADCSGMMESAGVKPTFIFAGEHKVEGNPYQPLSEEAKNYYQSEVDALYDKFLSTVARGRGIDKQEVLDNFGKGRTMLAAVAKRLGMIDDINTVQGALAACGVQRASPDSRRRIEDESPEFVALNAIDTSIEDEPIISEITEDNSNSILSDENTLDSEVEIETSEEALEIEIESIDKNEQSSVEEDNRNRLREAEARKRRIALLKV